MLVLPCASCQVDDIAPHVPHSELLLAAKAEGLLRLGKHERAREFCGQAVHLDEGPHREVRLGWSELHW